MSKAKNTLLFKERITKKKYNELILQLYSALDESVSLMELMLGTKNPDLYSNHGKYQIRMHNNCDGFNKSKNGDVRKLEKRVCKCLYYTNNDFSKNCDNCAYTFHQYFTVGKYKVIDYELPSFYYADGIGEIDLLIKGDRKTYATEVKPPKGNNETLLRMISEIITYTLGYSEGKFERAIGFFEKTAQSDEYDKITDELIQLIKKAKITVFKFIDIGNNKYEIKKIGDK